jgi:hypothetical protein
MLHDYINPQEEPAQVDTPAVETEDSEEPPFEGPYQSASQYTENKSSVASKFDDLFGEDA